MRNMISASIFLAGCLFAGPSEAATPLTDSEVRSAIIQQSIVSYPGNCPCPYNLARNGSSCGRRSAYTKPGGYAPICYPADVTQGMVDEYRRLHK